MISGVVERAWPDLDEFVEAFDRCWAGGGLPEIVDFLPARSHPQFLEVWLELIRVDLEWRWQRGCPKSLDDYRAVHPDCLSDPAALERVAFEEFRSRRQAGEPASAEEYSRRYQIPTSGWPVIDVAESISAESISTERTLFSGASPSLGRRAQASAAADAEFPSLGSEVLGFRLLSELGRGAFSRVYLARQGDLANRLVALKFSTESFAEADKLAQLQHAGIVPIYSVHRSGALCVVCMPYFGAATLADLLAKMRDQQALPDSGRALVDTLAAGKDASCRVDVAAPAPSAATVSGGFTGRRPAETTAGPSSGRESAPDLSALAGRSYVEAVLWLGARLAAGLAHAHQRGIVHRDLKPANVLMADDGRPMLLDFNLSEDLKRLPGGNEALVGGTLPYMAPEQLQAFRQRTGSSDPRSDLFSLGAILYELLAGRAPFPARQGALDDVLASMYQDRLVVPDSVQRANPKATAAVAAIIRRCLEADPERRYQNAADLQEDLDRQLTNLPLRHVREPSLRERAGKWVRRHPRVASASSIALVSMLLLAGLAGLLAVRSHRLAGLEAAESCQQFHDELHAVQAACLDAAGSGRDPSASLLADGRRALEKFHVLEDPDWRQSATFLRLPGASRQQLSADAGELLFLMAAMTESQADAQDAGDPRNAKLREAMLLEAMHFNELAESCFSAGKAPWALSRQRAAFAEKLGRREPSRAPQPSAAPRSPRDDCMAACLYSLERRFCEALPFWQRGVAGDPQNVWALYGLGTCYEQLSQQSHAIACYTACIALKPDFGDWYIHRGAAYLKQQEFALASADFDVAFRRQPERKDVLVNRALARLGERRYDDAIASLTAAIARGADDARVRLILAQALEQSGDSAGAARQRRCALQCEPADDVAWAARGVARLAEGPSAALADFDRALQANPHCLAALESKAHVLAEKLGRCEAAVQVLDRAVALYPQQSSAIAARGVLLARLGKREPALADARRALAIDHSDAIRYQVAGVYALLSQENPADGRRALELLASALRHGYGDRLIDSDADLDPIRNHPQFQQLLQAAQTLRAESREGS